MSLTQDFDFTGRRILVTGAANGFGEAMADLFHAAGATLVLADVEEELLARVHTAMRRSSRPVRSGDQFSFDDIAVDFSRMVLTRAGKTVALTAHEFKLLKFFVNNPEQVTSRDDLLNQVWGYDNYPSTRTVDNQVASLRRKLGWDEKSKGPKILTIHNTGYRFVD